MLFFNAYSNSDTIISCHIITRFIFVQHFIKLYKVIHFCITFYSIKSVILFFRAESGCEALALQMRFLFILRRIPGDKK